MKKLFTLLLLLSAVATFGQTPNLSENNHSIPQKSNTIVVQNSAWDETEPFVNQFARVLKGMKFTFINKLGAAISAPIFDGARNFSSHLAAVQINEKWGYVNEYGKIVIPCIYDVAYDFLSAKTVVLEKGRWKIIDNQGKVTSVLDVDICYGFQPNGEARIEKGNQIGKLTNNGVIVFENTTIAPITQRLSPAINQSTNTACPENLDFEYGNFTNWRTYTGTVDSVGNTNVITVNPSAPLANRHRIITRTLPSPIDFFGLFPTNPPDGSNYAVRLGNTNIGAQAERIAYTIRVPQNDSNFSVKYDYAVVFQDPGHTTWSQPRFVARLFDSAANRYVDCASFEYISTSNLPGFARSTVDTSVIYKPWASVFISLRAYTGRTMYLEFTTADCTRRGHWGYAYVDVENSCGQSVGVQYDCNFPNITTLDAPPGFQTYNWWNANYSATVATGQHAVLNPGPSSNTTLWLEMIPFNTFGCRDTLAISLTGGFTPSFHSSETNAACAPHNITFYNENLPSTSVLWNFGDGTTGTGNTVTHTYTSIGTYIVTMTVQLPSGCSGTTTDTITIAQPTASIGYTGGTFCNDAIVTFNLNAPSLLNATWNFGDGTTLTSTQTSVNHHYVNAGTYMPSVTVNFIGGCQITIPGLDAIKIENIRPAFSYVAAANCTQTTVVFSNQSASQFGISNYVWSFGDGTTTTAINPTHIYNRSGTFLVKLVATGTTGCKDSVTQVVVVSLLTSPVLSVSAPTHACQDAAVQFIGIVSPSTITSTITWTTNNGMNAQGDSVNFSFAQAGTYTITAIAVNSNGCADTVIKQIIIKPLPVVNQPGDQMVCNGVRTNAVVFISSITGTNYSWMSDNAGIGLAASGYGNIPAFTASNTTTSTVYANISVTATANGCSVNLPVFYYGVHPTPESIQPPNQTVCDRAATMPVVFNNFTSAVAANTYTWTNNLPSIGLASNGAGNISSFTAINNALVPAVATITITPTDNGCAGVPVQFTITVNPTPNVIPPANIDICNGASTNSIVFESTSGADVFQWTNSQPVIGLPSNGSGNINTFTAVNNSNAPIVANITVYPILNGCAGNTQFMTLTINPTPTVAQPINQTVCNGSAINNIEFVGTVNGTVYNWTNSLPSIGLATNGVGDILSFNPINLSNNTATANLTVTPVVNGCPGLPQSFQMAILPMADFIQPLNQMICNGQQTNGISFVGMVPNSTFTWTNNNTNIGLAATGVGNINAFVSQNTTNVTQIATIQVTATANNCPGNTHAFDIIVDPTPSMVQPSNITACSGTVIDSIAFVGSVQGTQFSWINTSSEIGLSANGNGTIPSFLAVNTHAYPVTANISVVGLANSCNSATNNFTITINPLPMVDSVPDQMLCNRDITNPIGVTGPVMGTGFTWSNNNPNIGLGASGSGDIPSFEARNNGTAPEMAVITVYGMSPDNCQTALRSFKIFVNATPSVSASNDLNLCRGSQSNLSASGANQYNWSPAIGLNCTQCPNPTTSASANTTYVVEGTNLFGCKSYDTVVVNIIQPFNMMVSPNDTLCTGRSIQLTARNAERYVWSPAIGLDDPTSATPTATPGASTQYRVIGYDSNNCFTDTGYVYVSVAPTPSVNAGADINAASGTSIQLNGTAQNGPITSWTWSPANQLSCDNCPNPILTVSNNIMYTLSVVNRFGCKAIDTLEVVTFCKSAQVFVPNAFTPDGDGINDILMVRGTGIKVKSFRIFNRWGNLVFEKEAFAPNEPKYGWDGKVKGITAAPDVYVYIAEVVCDNGTPYMYKGNVTILK